MGQIEFLSVASPAEFSEVWYDIADDDHFWIRWRSAAALREIRKLGLDVAKPLGGLDIGCGHGSMLRELAASTGWHIDGCDLNDAALSRSTGHNGRLLFYNIHDRRPELAQLYDFLLMFDVIEHIEDTRPFIESAAYHLKPGGYVFVNVPALQTLYSKYDAVAGHCRRYNRSLLRTELTRGGLEVCSLRYWGMTLIPIALARKLYVRTMSEPGEVIRRGFEPPGPLAILLLRQLEFIERQLGAFQPIGTSLFAVARKPEQTGRRLSIPQKPLKTAVPTGNVDAR
jgi:2-polyprenyl-3-methyl-5-hydroxy-6-metoxy-1,4-benzoquinol methylase